MYNFFTDREIENNLIYITGQDFNHIKNVLRMKIGENFLVSAGGKSSLCSLKEYLQDAVVAEVLEEDYQDTSLPVEIYLFQGLPKSDKLELIIQKAVELGVTEIIPVEMSRSIVKIEPKKRGTKIERWQAISESAAKQSKRTCVPKVNNIMSYREAISYAEKLDLILVPYENEEGMVATKSALSQIKGGMKIGVFIGPEGGFDDAEIQLARQTGAKIISLGKRILRTETASITAVGMIMLYAEISL